MALKLPPVPVGMAQQFEQLVPKEADVPSPRLAGCCGAAVEMVPGMDDASVILLSRPHGV